MSEVIQNETLFFLTAAATGVLLIFSYDLLRILRRVFRHGVILTGIEDFIYWSIAAFIVFCMIFEKNNGAVRGFAIVGILLGVILYHESISIYIVKGISFLLIGILKGISRIFDIICRPFRQIKKSFGKFMDKRLKSAEKKVKMKKEEMKAHKKGKQGKDEKNGGKKTLSEQ